MIINDLKLDPVAWDLVIENFDLAIVNGVEAIKQNLGQRLQTFLSEYFLDSRIGIPYFQEIFKKKFDPIVIETAFKREIINTGGVLEILKFELLFNNAERTMTLETKVLSSSGVFEYSLLI